MQQNAAHPAAFAFSCSKRVITLNGSLSKTDERPESIRLFVSLRLLYTCLNKDKLLAAQLILYTNVIQYIRKETSMITFGHGHTVMVIDKLVPLL